MFDQRPEVKRLGQASSLPLIVFESVAAQYDTNTPVRILEVPAVVGVK